MSTTRNDLERWFKEGLRLKATHMIVVCDTFDYYDFPRYVYPNQDVRKVVGQSNYENMETVMEVYNLSLDMNKQLKEIKSFNN